MPKNTWNPKRERQFEHIRSSLIDRGKDGAVAKEIAARTVNKERARQGEAAEASPSSLNDIASARRGGLRSHTGEGGRTFAQLYNEARTRGVTGRSRMNKAQLEEAVRR